MRLADLSKEEIQMLRGYKSNANAPHAYGDWENSMGVLVSIDEAFVMGLRAAKAPPKPTELELLRELARTFKEYLDSNSSLINVDAAYDRYKEAYPNV